MNKPFASAMSQALEQTRAGNPMEATRIIREALNFRGGHQLAQIELAGAERPRRPLGRVIEALVKGKRTAPDTVRHRKKVRPEVPDGARYEHRQHYCAFGSRAFAVFTPSGRTNPIRSLLIMLHGCTQDGDDFAVGTGMNRIAEREGLVVVYPSQNRRANQMSCWNWFRGTDQRRGSGEPALIADLTNTLAAEFDLPASRVFAAGLSAGGAMAAILGQAYPDVFAAIGVHSGLAPGAAQDVPGAYAAMRGQINPSLASAIPVPTIVFHGMADQTVHPSNGEQVLALALGSKSARAVNLPSAPECTRYLDSDNRLIAESWSIAGLGHAWSGGSPAGSYTYPGGVDASAEMVRFFLDVSTEAKS